MKDKIKGLGMGLDLLLKASNTAGLQTHTGEDLEQAGDCFSRALQEEEKDHFLEAYHLYRRVEELVGANAAEDAEKSWLCSRALNNAAAILNENGQWEEARIYLEKALEICPDNQVAEENLALLKNEK